MSLQDCIVIIPAYNEAKTVGQVIHAVQDTLGENNVVVVDDNSSDRTIEVVKKTGAIVLPLPARMGTWTAIQTGFKFALMKGYTKAITIDADGQHLAETILPLIREIESDRADLVIGSHPQRGSLLRQIAWSLFRRLSSFHFQDITSGLKAYNQLAMQLLLEPKAYLFDYQDVGTLLLLRRYGLRIIEVPVLMESRQDGHSRVFNNWFKVLRYMTITSILCACKFNQPLIKNIYLFFKEKE